MVITSDNAVESSLAMLGRFEDAGMDQRLARFRGRLRGLRDDPAEAARIDALVMEAEREELGEQVPDAASGSGLTIHVNSGVVNVSHGEADQAAGARDGTEDRLAALEAEMLRLRHRLEVVREDNAPSRTRSRRTWEAVLAPAFGGGVLVTILAAATVTTVLHATVAAMTVIAVVLAVATAVAASLSVWMPWSSVRALNRRGDAHIALELLSRGTSLQEARQQREQAEMLAIRARQFALEDREARWARQDQNAELERQRAERERERSQYEIEHREAMQRRRDELDARIRVVQMLAERGLLDSDSDLISDLVRRIGGEESSSPSRDDEPAGLTAPAERQ
jgi:hypothetical protein